VVDELVVCLAETDRVTNVGIATVLVMGDVVEASPRGRRLAARVNAAAVTDHDGPALVMVEVTNATAEI